MIYPPHTYRMLQLADGTQIPIDLVWVEKGISTPEEMRHICVNAGGQRYTRVVTPAEADQLRDQIIDGGTFNEQIQQIA